jgi:short-subunit dehydrogenase
VTDESSLKQVFAGLGAVDLLIANAGMAVPKLFVDQTDSEMHQMMNVNFFGRGQRCSMCHSCNAKGAKRPWLCLLLHP